MDTSFVQVPVLDNFYQTSSFYPMPVVMVTTVSESGLTNIGSYSLCFPFGIAEQHCMMLISRADSNTSLNIQRSKVCALNFIPNQKAYLKNAVTLGFPGETTEQKQKDSIFSLLPAKRSGDGPYPEIISEAIQVIECTWIDDPDVFHYQGHGEHHFLLKIENILMHPDWFSALKKGGKFPNLPIDYGYRDSTHFWFARHNRPFKIPIPKSKGISIDTVLYQVKRLPYDLEWEEDACETLCKIPRIFLKRVLESIGERAVREGHKTITRELLAEYRKKQ